ncbi:hypothetical protein Godav_022347, partial [Gossypium davidsonii]|nr:hypothetical protein [Gossypium davidsonii]
MEIFGNLREEDIEWRAPWMLLDEILYRCGNFDWVPVLGIWGVVGYAPLLNQTRRMKRLVVGLIATPEYTEWWGRRINDNISGPSQVDSQPTQKHPQVVPSELEIIKQDFKIRNAELEKKIEQMEEEKMNLRLDMDVQKLETEKLRKGKNNAEGDLDSLKTNYKRLRCSMKAAGLGKTSELNEKRELKARVAELEKILYQYRNRNSVMELRASLDKIEQMKRRNQVRNRDHIMREAVTQIRKVANYLQTLAVQADILSIKYELESDR